MKYPLVTHSLHINGTLFDLLDAYLDSLLYKYILNHQRELPCRLYIHASEQVHLEASGVDKLTKSITESPQLGSYLSRHQIY